MGAGETTVLTATVLPEDATSKVLFWSSSDKSVVDITYIDGYSMATVEAISEGTATITVATAGDKFTATCEVTVSEDPLNGHAYVEMGVTSADGKVLKWATMNVGATSETDYGDYFAWGETSTKTDFTWATYQHMYPGMSTYTGINKYQIADNRTSAMWYSDGIFIGDNITELERTDDAASANWGGTWRMPTDEEWTQLRNTDKFVWSWDSTKKGYTVTSKVPDYLGNSIFLPAAGYRGGSSLYDAGSRGYYWSSSLGASYSSYAWSVYFNSGDVLRRDYGRDYGRSVRPVSE